VYWTAKVEIFSESTKLFFVFAFSKGSVLQNEFNGAMV
jgi:hypothetical protein